MMSPAIIGAGCRRAMSTAAASRDRVSQVDRVKIYPDPARPTTAGRRVDPGILEDLQTVDGATVMPSPASSPWMRR
jgi:hypothetical protein